MERMNAVNGFEHAEDTNQVKVFSSEGHDREKYKLFYDFFSQNLSSQDISDLTGVEAKVVPVGRRSSESYDTETPAKNIIRIKKITLNPIVYTDQDDDAAEMRKFTDALNLKPKTVGPSYCSDSKTFIKNVKKQGKLKIIQIENEHSTNVVEKQQKFNKSDKKVSKSKKTTNTKGSKRTKRMSKNETIYDYIRETLDDETYSTIESDSDVSYEDFTVKKKRQVSTKSKSATSRTTKRTNENIEDIGTLDDHNRTHKKTKKVAEECEMLSVAERPKRWTWKRTTCYVLITEVPPKEVKQLKEQLQRLGAIIVTDVKQCTVVLTLQINRTFNLLCARGLGKPIMDPYWVQASAYAETILSPWSNWWLDIRPNWEWNFLKGCNMSATPSVTLSVSEMKLIVECSGGTWIEAGSDSAVEDCHHEYWTCVSCEADRVLWPDLLNRGATLVCTDYFLDAVLQQEWCVRGKAQTQQREFKAIVDEYVTQDV